MLLLLNISDKVSLKSFESSRVFLTQNRILILKICLYSTQDVWYVVIFRHITGDMNYITLTLVSLVVTVSLAGL